MLDMNWSPLTPPMMVGSPYTRLMLCSVLATFMLLTYREWDVKEWANVKKT